MKASDWAYEAMRTVQVTTVRDSSLVLSASDTTNGSALGVVGSEWRCTKSSLMNRLVAPESMSTDALCDAISAGKRSGDDDGELR